jgi:hypothetical protein
MTDLTPIEKAAREFLVPLSVDYPGIDNWFMQKVIPGIETGARFLLPYERDDKIVGLGIEKKRRRAKNLHSPSVPGMRR